MINKINRLIFAGFLDDEEKILFIAHRHVFVHLKAFTKILFFGLGFPVLLQLMFPEGIIFWASWFFVGFVMWLYKVFDWYYDAWIFTDVGVVDVEWNGFFDRSAARVDYHMIEGISYNVRGFWPTILNFGDIVLDRIGAATPVTLKDARRPRHIEKRFTHFHSFYVDRKRFANHESLKDLLAEMLADHIDKKGHPIETPK